MADPHRGGLCPDWKPAGFLNVEDHGDGTQTITCTRDGYWVREFTGSGRALEYSHHTATAEHEPMESEVLEWACIYGECDHDDPGASCPPTPFLACTVCRGSAHEGDLETFIPWPCKRTPVRDRHGDVWTLGDDGLMHTPETRPFPREHVEKKWGPLAPVTKERA